MNKFITVNRRFFEKRLAYWQDKKTGVYASKQTLHNGGFAYRIYNKRGGLVDYIQLKCDRDATVYYKEKKMVKYGDFRGQVYCEIEKNCEIDLPCSLDTKVDGVKLSTFFNFLREMAQEELAKDGQYLDMNDNIQELDELEEDNRTNAYIESEVIKKYE